MSGELFPYYERELLFLRQFAAEFAKQYPAAAGRLLLDENRSADPHVERMIESAALLTARVHRKIDDEFPELTSAMLDVLYPHFLAPIPSMVVLQFDLDATRAQAPEGVHIPRHSRLHTQTINDLACRFRTCYDTTLWPIEIVEASCVPPPFPHGFRPPPKTEAAIRIRLRVAGEINFSTLKIDRIRFCLMGDTPFIGNLYELIFNHTRAVAILRGDSKAGKEIRMDPAECLHPIGFGESESLLPYPPNSFIGYRLLTEFFAYPAKFHFIEISGLDRLRTEKFERECEIVLFLDRTLESVEQGVGAGTFRMGCTPAINLFDMTTEPIALTRASHEYRVMPDATHPLAYEVYSIDRVTGADTSTGKSTQFRPFYSLDHSRSEHQSHAFWHMARESSEIEGDRGHDAFLRLTDLAFDPSLQSDAVLTVRATCSNRDLPTQLTQAGEALRFELEAPAPLSRIRTLRPPTPTLRPPLRRGVHWRLISHLNLNHLSITDPVKGRDALREILRLYDFSDPATGQQMSAVVSNLIEGIISVKSRRVVAQTGVDTASGFCRGVEIEIEFDEEKYIGVGLFLFASALERFLGLYASINSFIRLVAKSKQREAPIKVWAPRAGETTLL